MGLYNHHIQLNLLTDYIYTYSQKYKVDFLVGDIVIELKSEPVGLSGFNALEYRPRRDCMVAPVSCGEFVVDKKSIAVVT